jgi:hypothetical protein
MTGTIAASSLRIPVRPRHHRLTTTVTADDPVRLSGRTPARGPPDQSSCRGHEPRPTAKGKAGCHPATAPYRSSERTHPNPRSSPHSTGNRHPPELAQARRRDNPTLPKPLQTITKRSLDRHRHAGKDGVPPSTRMASWRSGSGWMTGRCSVAASRLRWATRLLEVTRPGQHMAAGNARQ